MSEDRNVLISAYGKKDFLKIKQCLEIGKIQFSFVNMENPANNIDCFIEAEEFAVDLVNIIRNGQLAKMLAEEKAKGEQYPKAVWFSPIGGNATGNNGKPISRQFEISPSTMYDCLFTAKTYPATKSNTGAFIKVKGSQPLLTIRVPMTMKDLKILAYKWSYLEKDYMTRKYTVKNMTESYVATNAAAKNTDRYNNNNATERNTTNNNSDSNVAKTELIELIAISELTANGEKIKICKVKNGADEEYRLICLTNKITDAKFPDFENQLKLRISKKQSLKFKANVCKKNNDYYLISFA